MTDEQWERLRPLLPPQKPKTGRPSKDHRTILNAILWIDRTGAPWRYLPPEYGPWQSVATRFYRWVEAGVWDEVLAELQRQADAEGELDWGLHHVPTGVWFERTSTPPERKKGVSSPTVGTPAEDPEALGRSRGGFSTKNHLRAEGGGKP